MDAHHRRAGYEATLELLRRDPSLTAVVAANDTVALGACAALREAGLIPDDASVAGFDDLPFSIDAVPALTVRLPLSEAGARAGRIAMGREEPPPGGIATVRGVDGVGVHRGAAGLNVGFSPPPPLPSPKLSTSLEGDPHHPQTRAPPPDPRVGSLPASRW